MVVINIKELDVFGRPFFTNLFTYDTSVATSYPNNALFNVFPIIYMMLLFIVDGSGDDAGDTSEFLQY